MERIDISKMVPLNMVWLQDYFDYRDEAYKDKAMKWCHRHRIKVIIEKPTD